MQTNKKVNIVVGVIRLLLILTAIAAIFLQSWVSILTSVVTLALTYLPLWVEKRYKVDLPIDFELAIIVFIFSSLFLGEIASFYELFWWWDILLHLFSAVAFGCIGFIIMFILNKSNKLVTKPMWLAVFAFCFGVSIGALWEIFEFTMDQLFGMNMQKSGLVDTMWDLIVDCIGAFSASLAGFSYLKGNQKSYLSRLIGSFIKSNPDLEV